MRKLLIQKLDAEDGSFIASKSINLGNIGDYTYTMDYPAEVYGSDIYISAVV